MARTFVRQILMFDKFAPGIQAVIKGRMTGAEAYLACMKEGEEQSEDPASEALDVIEHKFDLPRDAESDIRRRNRRR